MLQGKLGKRSALFPSGHHTESKRRLLSTFPKNEKVALFMGKCHKCGRGGHRSSDWRNRINSATRTSGRNADSKTKNLHGTAMRST